MPNKIYTYEQKVRVVLGSLVEKIAITKYCQEQKVPRSTYYRWRKEFFGILAALWVSNGKELADRLKECMGRCSKNPRKRRYRCRIK